MKYYGNCTIAMWKPIKKKIPLKNYENHWIQNRYKGRYNKI
jgi:hypothetical protein